MNTQTNYLKNASIFIEKGKRIMPILGTVYINGTIQASNLDTSYVAASHDLPGLRGCYPESDIDLLNAGLAPQRPITIDEYPTIPAITETYGHETLIDSSLLAEQLTRAATCSSRDQSRYNLVTVYIDNVEQKIIGCDGHRLHVEDTRIIVDNGSNGAILPLDGVLKLIKLLKKHKKIDTRVSFSNLSARFQILDQTVYMRLVDAQYPDWKQIVPTERIPAFTLRASELLAALDIVSLVTTDKRKAVKFTVNGDNMLLTLSANSPELGKALKQIPNVGRNIIEMGFSSTYVQGFLKSCGKDERVTMYVSKPNDSLCPTIWFGERDDYTVIMPMRFE